MECHNTPHNALPEYCEVFQAEIHTIRSGGRLDIIEVP